MPKFDAALSSILGDKTARAFSKHLEIETIADLLRHYPRRYVLRGELTNLETLPVGQEVTVVAEVSAVNARPIRGKKGTILEVTITDGTGLLSITFFNQAWRANQLTPGARGLFAGKTSVYGGKLQLSHPDYELFDQEIDTEDAQAWAEKPIPIYPATSTLPSWKIQKSVELALELVEFPAEQLPAELRQEYSLLDFESAIRGVHAPRKAGEFASARKTIKFHEALGLLLQLVLRKRELEKIQAEVRKPGAKLAELDAMLPFELTSGQQEVSAAIFADLASGHPMNRLLQGDVGSGKTLVALRAMVAVSESGGQSALLAPTEVLASQHYHSVVSMLGPLATQLGVVLLTGSMTEKEKKRALLEIVSGKASIVIGTHALIASRVEFFDLSLVVIDEQHRFGVEQREALRQKAKSHPHTLIMTATPIPRTLAVTFFGDLEISSLTELPAGRSEIATHVVPVANPGLVSRVWQRVGEEISNSRQAFVVCPRIFPTDEEPELDEAFEQQAPSANVTEVFEALQTNSYLKTARIGMLHGQLHQDQKSQVMQDFEAGKLDLIVSTTVIEVGVNVPNATAMVILDADRFGLSQLHQLRGRVGRGNHPGVCLLLTTAEEQSLAMQRLQAIESTTDGFKLSELDLELRREGDVLGANQSGTKSSLRLLRVIADQEIINSAKKASDQLLAAGENLGPIIQLISLQHDPEVLAQG